MANIEHKVNELESKVRKLLNDRSKSSVVNVAQDQNAYASLTYPDAMANTGSYVVWTFGTELSHRINISAASKFNITNSGAYLIDINMEFQSAGVGTEVALSINGTPSTTDYYQLPDFNRLNAYVYPVCMAGIITLQAGDYVELKVKAASGTTTGAGGGFTITKVG